MSEIKLGTEYMCDSCGMICVTTKTNPFQRFILQNICFGWRMLEIDICSELVYDYLKRIAANMPFAPRKHWGVDTIIPDDFYNNKEHFEIIYEVKK
jgi:hypothetical protein